MARFGELEILRLARKVRTLREKYGLNASDARSKSWDEFKEVKFDFVITVCDNAHEELGHVGRLHWSVPDPVRVGTQAAFDAAFSDLTRRVNDLAPRVTAS